MAADDLSTANLPPVSWASHTSSRDSGQEPGDKEKKDKKVRDLQPKSATKKTAPLELEFEPTEHELDSIA